MDTIYSWASSQPIWLQVVIGLTLFSIGFPVVLLCLYYAWRVLAAIDEVAMPIVTELTKVAMRFALWLALAFAGLLALRYAIEASSQLLAYQIAAVFSMAPAELQQLRERIATGTWLVLTVGAPTVIYLSSNRLRSYCKSQIESWRAAIGADRDDETPNPSIERTRSGSAGLAFISFWAKPTPPPRAAHIKR